MGIGEWQAAAGRMSFEIRRATADDVVGISAIEREAFSDPWSAQAFHDAIDHPAIYFTCAHDGAGSVLGYVVAWFVADQGEIANLAVAPAGWGTGIGRALLTDALEEGKTRGADAVFLEVRDSNQRARRLYAASGFEEVGRRRRYYSKPVEDALVLRRALKEM